jgi:putative tryptophan/tyrosine transport system substrate-binding protein
MRKQSFNISVDSLFVTRSLCAALFLALCSMLLAPCSPAEAQQPAKKTPRVGILSLTAAPVQKDRIEAFREALRKLGYVGGQSVNFEYRYGDNKSERMAGLAAELVALKVDVIVTTGSGATQPAKKQPRKFPLS